MTSCFPDRVVKASGRLTTRLPRGVGRGALEALKLNLRVPCEIFVVTVY